MSDVSDMLALANNIKDGDGFGGNSSWFWVLILFFFIGNGFGWGGNAAAQNSLTRAEMQDGFNNQNLVNGLTNMSNQINSGFDNVTLGMSNGFNSVNQNINNLGYQMAQNCCDLKSTMHAECEATRALITQNTISELQAKIADKDRELQSAIFAASQLTQTNNLENFMRSMCNSGCSCGC